MEPIWGDETVRDSFRTQFHDLAARSNGTISDDTDTTVFCTFEPSGHRPTMRVGVYYANGRNTFRFDTVREEIELAMMNRFEIDRSRLIIGSERGSRRFELDAAVGDWKMSKEQV
jgi:hypothetical protein